MQTVKKQKFSIGFNRKYILMIIREKERDLLFRSDYDINPCSDTLILDS